MKKMIALLLALVLTLSVLPAFAEKAPDTPAIAGRLALGDAESISPDWKTILSTMPEVREYYSLTSLMLALQNGEIATALLPKITADYIAARRPEFETRQTNNDPTTSYCMAVLPSNNALAQEINNALSALRLSRELERLEEEWIANLSPDAEPTPVALPRFDGAPTYTVGVTGDIPPMDYIAADGTPSGFNTALLNALAEEMQVNFELVSIAADARVMALATGKIDIAFWMSNASFTVGEAGGGKLIFTLNYLQCQMALLTKTDAPVLYETASVPDLVMEMISGEGNKAVACEVFTIQIPSFPDDTFIAVSPADFDKALSQVDEGDVLVVPLLTGQACAALQFEQLLAAGQKGVSVCLKRVINDTTGAAQYYILPEFKDVREPIADSVLVARLGQKANEEETAAFRAAIAAAGIPVNENAQPRVTAFYLDDRNGDVKRIDSFDGKGAYIQTYGADDEPLPKIYYTDSKGTVNELYCLSRADESGHIAIDIANITGSMTQGTAGDSLCKYADIAGHKYEADIRHYFEDFGLLYFLGDVESFQPDSADMPFFRDAFAAFYNTIPYDISRYESAPELFNAYDSVAKYLSDTGASGDDLLFYGKFVPETLKEGMRMIVETGAGEISPMLKRGSREYAATILMATYLENTGLPRMTYDAETRATILEGVTDLYENTPEDALDGYAALIELKLLDLDEDGKLRLAEPITRAELVHAFMVTEKLYAEYYSAHSEAIDGTIFYR